MRESSPYNFRCQGHDYYAPFIYHIILKKRPKAPIFSKLIGNTTILPGNPGSVRPDYTKLGYAIYNSLKKFIDSFPEFLIHQYSIMPDHIHIILQKLVRTDTHLEDYIKILKEMVAKDYHENQYQPYIHPENIFSESFTDKILFERVSLKAWIDYVAQNPYRRAVIKENPENFKMIQKISIKGRICQVYGNNFLLSNPDKIPVRVRRHFTQEEFIAYKNYILKLAESGTVLVSPFRSEREKEIKHEAEALGCKLIILKLEAFPDHFKPFKHEFELCSEGRLLLISLGLPKDTSHTYALYTQMNEWAGEICKG